MLTVDMHAHPLLERYYTPPGARLRRFLPPGIYGSGLDLDELHPEQIGVLVSSIYPFWTPAHGPAYLARCRDILNTVEAYLAQREDRLALVTEPAGIAAAVAAGKIALVHAVEGGHVLEGRVESLRTLFGWGVRSLTLTHFLNNDLAASSLDPRRHLAGRDGLTPLGRDAIAAMDGLGMIVDLAHVSERAFWQAMEVCRRPVLVSHVGIRHFVPHELCLTDGQIRAVAQNGGVIGIICASIWLRRGRLAGIEDLVDNILYVCRLVGAGHVGLGTDFNGTPAALGLARATALPLVGARLRERGLPPEDVEKVMGGNFLRLWAQVAH